MSHTGLKALDEVAQTICLPNERAPIRLPTYPSIDKTAVFRYRYQNTHSLRDVPPASELNVLGRKRFVVTRDPAAPLLVDSVHNFQNYIGGNPDVYSGSILVRAESVELNNQTTGAFTSSMTTFDKMYPWEYYKTLPCGVFDNKQWFPVPRTLDSSGKSIGFLTDIGVGLFLSDGASSLAIPVIMHRTGAPIIDAPTTLLPGMFSMDYTLTFECISSTGIRSSHVLDFDFMASNRTGLGVFDKDTALVRIQSLTCLGPLQQVRSGGDATPFTLGPVPMRRVYPTLVLSQRGVSDTGGPGTFRCLSLPAATINPEYYNSVAPFRSTRLNSSALLLTNVTKVLNKEGTVESSRVIFNPDSGSTFHHADVPLVSTSNPETRYFGALEKGAYTFTAPDQESLEFTTPYETVTVNDSETGLAAGDGTPTSPTLTGEREVVRPVLNLNARYMNVMILSDLDITDDTQLAMTLDTHWEFRTISTLYQLDYSRMPIEVYHAAMLACMRAGLFYENNTHQKILQAVGKGLKFAAPLVPGGNLLQLAHSAAQAVVDHRAKQKQKQPKSQPPSKTKQKGSMKQKGFK